MMSRNSNDVRPLTRKKGHYTLQKFISSKIFDKSLPSILNKFQLFNPDNVNFVYILFKMFKTF